MEDTWIRFINYRSIFCDLQLAPLAPNIFFCFSIHLGVVFFFFPLLSVPSSVLQWNHEGGNLFSEYDRFNWLLYVGYYSEVPSSLLDVRELVHQLLSLTILSSPFSSCTKFQSSPITSAPIFLVSRSLSHIK